ncbi:MAG TPA: hypothetical protein VNN19_03280 [bacterium]|nr:hypothetical protein [bacterium]
MDPLFSWLYTQLRARLDERGQAELIVVALIVFLLWLYVTGRRVVVQ